MLQTEQPVDELASVQNQRTASEQLALLDLEDIDTLIKLDNRWLANQFETVLKAQAAQHGTYSFRKMKTTFINQIIMIETLVDIKDEYGNTITATLSGDILLKFRANGLEWRAIFGQLQISSRDFTFANGSYAEAGPELTQTLLQGLNTGIAQAVVENGKNTIPLNPVPLGEIQVGASLPGFVESTARNTQSLRGVFMLAGSALLIDSSFTNVVLDLAFIPDLSTCPADVTVSRTAFASDIQSREPVGIAHNMDDAADVRYFFSEIAGARHPLTIIHYWFADGLPLAVEELAVGQSERWRTWSAKGTSKKEASQWEVLVVEKESGCILASESVSTLEPEIMLTRANPVQAQQAFTDFKNKFNDRISGFAIIHDKPGIALIEVRRLFLREVLQASLADLNIVADFAPAALSDLQFAAELQVFDTEDIICEHRDCHPAPVCTTSPTQCIHPRDTRDCSSCQFRNPLNNRCISEAVDPLCEAARNRQNARYDDERSACIARAENVKRECEQLNAQVLSSCQIESGFEASACESIKAGLKSLNPGAPLAVVSAQAKTSGTLSVNFSNFLIEGDLERLKLDMSLQSNLQQQGKLSFKPVKNNQALAKCITAWSQPFSSRFASSSVVHDLLSKLEQDPDKLTALWSGFGITMESQPSPLESVFVDKPELLANCHIGLSVSKVEQEITGQQAAFFIGQTELVIQPLPTKIRLAPATIEFGNMVYSAGANLTAQHLQYDIQE